jgi:hypothetical protein
VEPRDLTRFSRRLAWIRVPEVASAEDPPPALLARAWWSRVTLGCSRERMNQPTQFAPLACSPCACCTNDEPNRKSQQCVTYETEIWLLPARPRPCARCFMSTSPCTPAVATDSTDRKESHTNVTYETKVWLLLPNLVVAPAANVCLPQHACGRRRLKPSATKSHNTVSYVTRFWLCALRRLTSWSAAASCPPRCALACAVATEPSQRHRKAKMLSRT